MIIKQKTLKYRHAQLGFLLPAAIFILVVLSLLGAYAVNMSVMTNALASQDIQGSRAYLAARAGLEWGGYRVLLPGSTSQQACFSSPTTITINNFTVSVTCSSYSYKDQGGDQDISVYRLVSTASAGAVNTPDYVERQAQVILSRCLDGTVSCS